MPYKCVVTFIEKLLVVIFGELPCSVNKKLESSESTFPTNKIGVERKKYQQKEKYAHIIINPKLNRY